MELGEDLSAEALAPHVQGRELRSYPAMLSTEADAMAWARAGAAAGAVVVADYQASPRGRGGLEWQVRPGEGLGFSVVLRPRLDEEHEGWLYVAASTALADVAGGGARLHWPDEVRTGERRVAAVGVHTELGPAGVAWATVTALIDDAVPPRGPLLAQALTAIEARASAPPADVLDDYRGRCATLGRDVTARLVPMGPAGVVVQGEAVDVRDDGSLVIATDEGRRIAVRPQHLGVLESA